ncbi:hypothetical protein JTE90_005193 [Oedothorax gibbosus]|uniref:Uncharacterized protein n=1 Tax=Oedothorax gibbosus TaxID=931172 RepID=A0AAV6UJL0_9ARAC|nr:hypothetical protein JTE90_005193 [Oedothorax gibbosus]
MAYFGMIFYTIFVTFGTFHLTPALESKVLFALGLLALCVSGMCVMSSALLLVGLCADNRTFLLPWLVCVSMATLLDVFLCFYFMAEDNGDQFHLVLFFIDFLISALNIYCVLCVISQYQEYSAGRGRPEDIIRMESRPESPCLRFNWPSFQVLNQSPAHLDHAKENVEITSRNHLTVPRTTNFEDRKDHHQSTHSLESSSKNTTSVLSSDDIIDVA